MSRTFFWLFLFFFCPSKSQRLLPPSQDVGLGIGNEDKSSQEAEDEKELDLAESIFRQLRLHLSAAGFPEQIRRLASAKPTISSKKATEPEDVGSGKLIAPSS